MIKYIGIKQKCDIKLLIKEKERKLLWNVKENNTPLAVIVSLISHCLSFVRGKGGSSCEESCSEVNVSALSEIPIAESASSYRFYMDQMKAF